MTTKFYLDKRSGVKGHAKDDLFPIKISINSKGSSAYIGTGIKVQQSQWDSKKGVIILHPLRARLNMVLSEKKLEIDKAVERLRSEGLLHGLSVSGIKAKVEAEIEKKSNLSNKTVMACFDEYISLKEKPGTKQVYIDTRKKLCLFVQSPQSFLFTDITVSWLTAFDAFLAQSAHSANSRSIHLRNVRTIFNYALTEGYTEAPYPFKRFKIQSDPTGDRSLSLEELRCLFDAKCTKAQEKYRDIFKLSFFLCGINLADLMSLKEIKGGRIEFRRIKTGQPISIKVQPEAAKLITKYRGRDTLIDISERCKNYKNYLHRMNDALKRIGQEYNPHTKKWEGSPAVSHISFYSARYSWATIAAELDIPERTIGAALGHSTAKSVTSIYTRVDMRKKVDKANRLVIDALFDAKEGD